MIVEGFTGKRVAYVEDGVWMLGHIKSAWRRANKSIGVEIECDTGQLLVRDFKKVRIVDYKK